MLTIRAMVEMGPWFLDHIHVLPGRHDRCMRCTTKIKNVWVMEKLTDPTDTWRIGSCCGPKLQDMSEEVWDLLSKPFRLSLAHLTTLERLIRWEHEKSEMAPPGYQFGWAAEQQHKLAQVIRAHERRVMGSQVSRALNAWKDSMRHHHLAARRRSDALQLASPSAAL